METRSNRITAVVTLILAAWMIAIAGGLSFSTLTLAQEDTTTINLNPPPEETIAVVIPCTDMIDDGLFQSIKRRSQEAIDAGATYLIYEIQTYGGLVKSADDISKYWILDVGRKVKTCAFVTTEAISAGAMISVACKDIIMLENTTIGDSAPIVMGDKLEGVEREKAETFIRATFSRAAEANGYPEALLRAMVTQQLEVFQVKNLKTGEIEYLETKDLPSEDNADYDVKNKKLIVTDKEILTLTASKAKEYGIAREVVKSLDEALEFLEKRDGVKFAEEKLRLETNWSEELVRFLQSPMVSSILVLGFLLGAYMEFKAPGLGLPGLVAVICLVLMIGSKYMAGMADWIEVAIFIVGLILLGVELFVIPGFGVAGISGIILMAAGAFGMLIKNDPGEIPWPDSEVEWELVVQGLAEIALGFVGFLILAWLLAKYMPKIPFLRSLILAPAVGGVEMTPDVTTVESEEATVSVGDVGTVVSALRPAGQAKFAGKVVDVVTQGQFIEKDVRVVIAKIQGNRVVVNEYRSA